MKWFWRIHRVNGSFDFAIKEIGGCPFKNLDSEFNCEFAYLCFDGETMGSWTCSSDLINGNRYLEIVEKGYEFKGNVGIKELRKQKIQKIQNETIY